MKRMLAVMLGIIMAWSLAAGAAFAASGDEVIRWSKVKTGTYDPLHLYTLNWSGDVLDRGGLSLTTLKAASSKEADIVINQSGAIGANGIVKLSNEKLEDSTKSSVSGFTNSLTAESGAVYLIKLHDGKLAKLRLDLLTSTKASFSYVVEEGRQPASGGTSPAPGSSSQTGTTPQQPAPVQQNPSQPAQNVPSSQPQPAAPAQPGGQSASGQQPAASGSGAQTQTGSTKPWSETYEVPGVPFDQPFNLYLRLDSKFAMIYEKNGKRTDYELHTAPFLHDGRTMVPVRFISEALGAKVGWRDEDQSIAIVTEKTAILLQLDNKSAVVDKKTFELDAPPIIKDGSTVVPLRFVSEHLDMFVYFDNGSILITDTERSSYEDSWGLGNILSEPPPGNSEQQGNQPAASGSGSDASALIGKWNLWIPGGFTAINTTVHGDGSKTVTSAYTPGAAGDWIRVDGDGTYEWIDIGKTYKGGWAAKGSGLITLYGGPMDSDWTMRLEGEGEMKIFAWGIEYKGSKAEE